MTQKLAARLGGMDRNYLLFLLSTVFVGFAQSIDGAALTNYLKDNLHMMIMERSALEFPRELPGLLILFVIAALHSLGDVRTAMAGHLLAAAGMTLLGFVSSDYLTVALVVFLYSMGQHIYMPLSSSIGMNFANAGEMGRQLGRISAANTAALVAGSAALWLLFRFVTVNYTLTFAIGAACYVTAAGLLFLIKPGVSAKRENRFVFKREYRLYYWLCLLFGARKQIFITFGPWVLVDVFQQPVTTMTVLFFVVSVIGIFAKPWLGRMLDELGERRMMGAEALAFFFVCLGYAFAADLFPPAAVVPVVALCYILDQVMSAISMARATYLKKIAVDPADVSPTLSLGTSLDHIMTMFLPLLGGMVWYNAGPNGYKYVFLGGAALAVINYLSSRLIQLPDDMAGKQPKKRCG